MRKTTKQITQFTKRDLLNIMLTTMSICYLLTIAMFLDMCSDLQKKIDKLEIDKDLKTYYNINESECV